MSAASSRRALIGSSAALLVACAFEAGATKADELDGDIINASRDFIAVEAELDRLIDSMDAMSERKMDEADVQTLS